MSSLVVNKSATGIIKSVENIDQLSGMVMNANGGDGSDIVEPQHLYSMGLSSTTAIRYWFRLSCTTEFMEISRTKMEQLVSTSLSFLK